MEKRPPENLIRPGCARLFHLLMTKPRKTFRTFSAYQLAEPDAEQAALWVLVKTKEPKIEWHPTQRSPEQSVEYLAKAEYVAGEIQNEHFYKRPGKWCSYCDYLPMCMGDHKKADETLTQIT
jgi:PD-(D/E)XK nuclease superfamily protein